MKKSDRFENMDAVRTEKARLRAAREGYRYNLKEHWTVLGEKEFRRGMVGDVFGELIGAWRPMKAVMAFMDHRPQTLANMAASMLGPRKETPWGKAIMWGLTAATPYLTEKIGGNKNAENLLSEVQRSWFRIKDYIRQRRARHNGVHV
ncbi:MAG: hypothetical protein M3R08_01980 [Bacteroidota bacterium]|nr:hypothetical protein [Bacteroidota bacterium]